MEEERFVFIIRAVARFQRIGRRLAPGMAAGGLLDGWATRWLPSSSTG